MVLVSSSSVAQTRPPSSGLYYWRQGIRKITRIIYVSEVNASGRRFEKTTQS